MYTVESFRLYRGVRWAGSCLRPIAGAYEKRSDGCQVARVADAFTQAGIMVHAYLMYGFPTQTMQETIDSLEMVRQLFMNGIVQSGFWHRFAMTAHSPVGVDPAAFDVMRLGPTVATGRFDVFADNDLEHSDPTGADHDLFAEGLRKSLFNYMHDVGFDLPLQKWFMFKVPVTSIPPRYIEKAISQNPDKDPRPNAFVIWPGHLPSLEIFELQQGRKVVEMAELEFYSKQGQWLLEAPVAVGQWLMNSLPRLLIGHHEPCSLADLKASFETTGPGNFDTFTRSTVWGKLREHGLLIV